MDDRRSHWPIFNVVPIEMIKVVSEAVRRTSVDPVAGKDGKVVYFLSNVGDKNVERKKL